MQWVRQLIRHNGGRFDRSPRRTCLRDHPPSQPSVFAAMPSIANTFARVLLTAPLAAPLFAQPSPPPALSRAATALAGEWIFEMDGDPQPQRSTVVKDTIFGWLGIGTDASVWRGTRFRRPTTGRAFTFEAVTWRAGYGSRSARKACCTSRTASTTSSQSSSVFGKCVSSATESSCRS